MTTQEKLVNMLVIALAKPELKVLSGTYDITFDRPAEEYPDAIYNVLFLVIKPIALKWIEKNKPMAWFKAMFE